MNRMQMINTIAATGGVTKKVAEQQLTALLSGVKDALKAGEDVTVTDDFKLSVESRAARTGRNPKTGEPLQIAASVAPKFTPGSVFKAKVKHGESA